MIDSQFWKDKLMRSLPEDSRILMFYFLTSPSNNLMGFFSEPESITLYYINWDSARYIKARSKLIETQRISADDNEDLILINNFLKWNPIYNPNSLKKMVKTFSEIPNTPLIRTFYESVKKLGRYDDLLKAIETRLETLPETVSTIQPIKQHESKKEIAPQPRATKKEPSAEVREFVFLFNETLNGVLPSVKEISKEREIKIEALLKKYTKEKIIQSFNNVKASDWLCGRGEKSWSNCNFDWIIQEKNFLRIFEGTYSKTKIQSKTKYESQMEELDRIIEEERAKMKGAHSDEQTGNSGTFENNNFDIPES